MDSESMQQTQGSVKDGYIPVNPESGKKTSSTGKEDQYNDKFGLKYIPPLLKSLEDNLPFTAILIGIIGYIVISSFGHMDSSAKYFGYTIFLFVSFLMYRLLGRNKIKIEYDFKNTNPLLIFVLIVFLIIFLIEHNIIISVFNYIISILSKK